MSKFLNQRSLKAARQLITFRVALVGISLAFFSLGTACALYPAAESLGARWGEMIGGVARWVLTSAWVILIPRIFIGSLSSVEGLDDALPRLSSLIQAAKRQPLGRGTLNLLRFRSWLLRFGPIVVFWSVDAVCLWCRICSETSRGKTGAITI